MPSDPVCSDLFYFIFSLVFFFSPSPIHPSQLSQSQSDGLDGSIEQRNEIRVAEGHVETEESVFFFGCAIRTERGGVNKGCL